MAKFEITNPDAIKFINDFKSGALYQPVIIFLKKYRWYLISSCLFLLLIIFIALGKILYRSVDQPQFLPPKLETVTGTPMLSSKSEYENIRQEILNYSTELPDPVIPEFDNNIKLEASEEEIQLW